MQTGCTGDHVTRRLEREQYNALSSG